MGLFDEQVSRKPDNYPWTEKFIDAIHEGHWTHKEFTFKSDLNDFKVKMTKKERDMIVKCLSSIGQVEISVKKFWARLGDNLPHPSISDMGHVFGGNEVVHGRAYFNLLSVLGLEDEFQNHLKEKALSGRVKYLRKHLSKKFESDKKQYIYSLILFTLFVENVSLFSQFYIILWMGRFRNLLKDTNQQVLYTSKEENLHKDAGISIIKTLRKEYPELFDKELKELVEKECLEAYDAEAELIDWIIDGFSGERINSVILKDLVKARMNASLKAIGFKKMFEENESSNRDIEWFDEEILGSSKIDFFHQRPVDYAKNASSFSAEELF